MDRDFNTFLLWMQFYSRLLQRCRKSGRDKEDHLHIIGNLLSLRVLVYNLGLHPTGSVSRDLSTNHDQPALPRERSPGNGARGGRVQTEPMGAAERSMRAARAQFSELAPHPAWEYQRVNNDCTKSRSCSGLPEFRQFPNSSRDLKTYFPAPIFQVLQGSICPTR